MEENPHSPPPGPTGPEAWQDLTLRAAEFSEYVGSYLRAQRDKAAYSLRRALTTLFLFFFLGLFFAGVLIMGIAYFFYGISLGLKGWFGSEWLAFLVTGGSTLAVFGIWLKFGLLGTRKKSLDKKLDRYEAELKSQQERFGHDAAGRAAEWAER